MKLQQLLIHLANFQPQWLLQLTTGKLLQSSNRFSYSLIIEINSCCCSVLDSLPITLCIILLRVLRNLLENAIVLMKALQYFPCQGYGIKHVIHIAPELRYQLRAAGTNGGQHHVAIMGSKSWSTPPAGSQMVAPAAPTRHHLGK